MTFDDFQLQIRPSEPIVLAGVRVPRPPALPPEVIAGLAAIAKRRKLVRSPIYEAHAAALLELTYGIEYEPAADPSATAAAAAGHSRGDDFLRVASWNIQRGRTLGGIKALLPAHEILRDVDVWLLNEVDLGMARSGNRHVAAELAEQLGFGYVFGNSYLCLDHGDARDGEAKGENGESLHGNAILSRYPFRRAENFSVAITKDKFHSSEKRLGHKKALWGEIDTPLGALTVAALHLDAYAASAQRAAQLKDALEILARRGVIGRALLGGDFNTNTYDAASPAQIVANLIKKLARGGFPHAIYHYVHPDELYERAVFAELAAAGFDYHGFNAPEVGTTRYEVGSYDSESTVAEQLPSFAVKLLRRKLAPWGGVAPLKVDWFAGRGVEAVPGSPVAIESPTVGDVRLSDHDPIVVDIRF